MRTVTLCFVAALPFVFGSCGFDRASTGPSRETGTLGKDSRPSANAPVLTTVACGAQITSDITLDNDLSCAGNALLVSGDDIRIDLNGHTLSGAAAGNGITVTASHGVTIFGGTVTGFLSGIFVAGSTDVVIAHNEFTLNREAVLFQATSGSVIRNNVASNSLMRAFMIRPNMAGGLSTDNFVLNNLITDTPTGIYLIRQPRNVIQANTISGASIAAIDLGPGAGSVSGNVIRANLLSESGAGIRFGTGWTDNWFVGNRIAANACGVQGSTDGNAFNGNVYSANGADSCP